MPLFFWGKEKHHQIATLSEMSSILAVVKPRCRSRLRAKSLAFAAGLRDSRQSTPRKTRQKLTVWRWLPLAGKPTTDFPETGTAIAESTKGGATGKAS